MLKLNNAPSIPSHNNVFGYEETEMGGLVKQGNPEKVFAGTPGDTVGPGHYKIEGESKRTGTNWHASRVNRPMFLKAKEKTIGPGSYEVIGNSNPLSNRVRGTSCFVSTVPKPMIKEYSTYDDECEDEVEEEQPGPGHYDPKMGAFEKRPATSQIQQFGLTAARFAEKLKNNIGPGQYNFSKQISV